MIESPQPEPEAGPDPDPGPAAGDHPSVPHPLRRLWVRHRAHRSRVLAAITCTVINKVADVMPELPIGAAVDVGERGQTRSGGQRQRLALARAILRDPALLVLDEATSGMDNETERAIQRSLATVTRGRTAVMVAHRLSTRRNADRIWVLERGRLVESGTQDDLIVAAGAYADLWSVQTGAIPAPV